VRWPYQTRSSTALLFYTLSPSTYAITEMHLNDACGSAGLRPVSHVNTLQLNVTSASSQHNTNFCQQLQDIKTVRQTNYRHPTDMPTLQLSASCPYLGSKGKCLYNSNFNVSQIWLTIQNYFSLWSSFCQMLKMNSKGGNHWQMVYIKLVGTTEMTNCRPYSILILALSLQYGCSYSCWGFTFILHIQIQVPVHIQVN